MTTEADDKLGCAQAIFEAIAGKSISFFPRADDNRAPGRLRTLTDKEAIEAISAEVKHLAPDEDTLEDALKVARESLDEVTAQTNYQDGKATRLLTILTFMSAFSGFAFNRLADGYPLSIISWVDKRSSFNSGLVVVSYLLFAAFALLATSGALVTFHAIRARFRYPRAAAKDRPPASMLFWMGISRTQPNRWAKAFIDPADPKKVAPELRIEYLRNYIVETYLVAAKVADKVRFLEPAQRIQSWAIKALFFWIIVTAFVFAFVQPVKKESNPVIRIETPISSVCITGGNNVSTAANGQPCSPSP
ncbi:hypothetical protein [Phyllobacterium endophyticum]|uniref:Uncharacterized protein n=1 Tax=Phyllobacterium endophyticum TaxID=1149773 RepID=A0A2P7ASH5_9HYPH|nr:hypothetical protein [Phyllobacterium endophyticum]MBB3236937.1 hypothetical protein [Phyllobacterium endophyticum]PSH57174.1 hypothetical protein CU100_18180 [Phyllobacterium endophyticum]TYR40453.1 hypothetical protein FY050_18190 [Phyllobacterium endophyticum]